MEHGLEKCGGALNCRVCFAEAVGTDKREGFFRKKPVTIEARQFVTNNEPGPGAPNMDALVLWMNQGKDKMKAWHNGTDIFIKTFEGEMRASCGDWIIRGVKGEFYPCKSDVFAATYEFAPDVSLGKGA